MRGEEAIVWLRLTIYSKVKVAIDIVSIEVFTDLLARLDAILLRHVDVKDNHAKVMHRLRENCIYGLLAITNANDLVKLLNVAKFT